MRVPFESLDFLQTEHIALAAVEGGTEKYPDEIGGKLRADHLGAQAEHAYAVVLDALVGGVDVVADRGANTGELAGGHARTDARTANEDAALGVAGKKRLADLPGLVRIVDPYGIGVRPQVDDVVPERRELLEHALPQLDAAMVERDGHPHMGVTLPTWTTHSSGVSSVSSSASTPFA